MRDNAGSVAGGPEREARGEPMPPMGQQPESHDERHVAERAPQSEEAAAPPTREFHAQPREPSAPHEPAPLAHFEPSPKPEPNKPYVVWSSAPPDTSAGGRGSEE